MRSVSEGWGAWWRWSVSSSARNTVDIPPAPILDPNGMPSGDPAKLFGSARQVRISAERTLITAGNGNQVAIDARREQIKRQYDAALENIERDKFQERLAKLAGGTAIILLHR